MPKIIFESFCKSRFIFGAERATEQKYQNNSQLHSGAAGIPIPLLFYPPAIDPSAQLARIAATSEKCD